MLLERIHDVEADIPNQRLSGELIVRESTATCQLSLGYNHRLGFWS